MKKDLSPQKQTEILAAILKDGVMGFDGMKTTEVWDYIHANDGLDIPKPQCYDKLIYFALGMGMFTIYRREGRKMRMVNPLTKQYPWTIQHAF